MTTDTIEYRGKHYPIRWLTVSKYEKHAVGTLALEEVLMNADGSAKTGRSEDIDNSIWYYCDEEEWHLPDSELIDRILKPNK